ncbi:Uncharacterised protein [Halioglobus japonicus]|nr:Uncharacterised protein [Halioglobus japonicus]
MVYLCLDEVAELLDNQRFWSASGPALAEFRRSDFLGDPAIPLQDEVRRRIHEETGARQTGPIYLLANLRFFGYVMNPIACYYCFNDDETELEYVVAEVNNTPWDERYSYVLPGPGAGRWLKTSFDKEFHVSPFNPMGMRYHWRSNTPSKRLVLHMENSVKGDRVFDATLSLTEQPMTTRSMHWLLIRYPFMTAKVVLAIYWQALRLYLKGVPVHPHPENKTPERPATGAHNE